MNLSERIGAGGVPLGVAVQIDSTWIVEMCALAGYDYVLLDGEHGAVGARLEPLELAAQAHGIDAIVRVGSEDRGVVLPVLESRPSGIWFPMVESVEQARALVDLCKYAPVGRRGFSLATRASDFGALTRDEHVARANRECLLILTIETARGVAAAADIAALDGVDLIFVGRDDLTEDLGAGSRSDSRSLAAVDAVLDAAAGRVPVGTTAFDRHEVEYWTERGMSFLLTGSTATIRSALRAAHDSLRPAPRAVPPRTDRDPDDD